MNTITVHVTVEGIHRWPDAPPHRAYLSYPHRHRFGVTVTVGVAHDDRDVEFHDLADHTTRIMRTLGRPYHPDALLLDFGAHSCEWMANLVAEALANQDFDLRSVSVDEDGEATATYTREP